ncbi:MAG: hypothetical protein K8R48_00085 [Alphaproteobacteria bacterium]|nr:hypothetical protein [Alphaproteobacteria bacterium]
MTDIKTQFNSAHDQSSGYLRASLSFMAADTRYGLGDEANADFAVIKKYAASHPERQDIVNYVSKVESLAKKTQSPTLAKPTNKM